MTTFTLKDMIGPIMIGPSSSHTAGACRIGLAAKQMIQAPLLKVTLVLYGSFAKTYRGHGTDIALIGGLLGFTPDDERLVDSFALAKKSKLAYSFQLSDEEPEHPNTVKILAQTTNHDAWEIVGTSVGGGKIVITQINGTHVRYTGTYPTLIINHPDSPGMLAKIATILSEFKINIAFMRVYREVKGHMAISIIETDDPIMPVTLEALLQIKGITDVKHVAQMYV